VREPQLVDQQGVRTGLGGGILFVLTAVGVATGLPAGALIGLLLAASAVLATVVDRAPAVLLGVTGWALATGFGVNDLGRLTFAMPDLLRLAAYLLVPALLAAGEGAAQ
jgi:hypothetical protein